MVFFSLILIIVIHICTCFWVGMSFINSRSWMSVKIGSLADGGEDIDTTSAYIWDQYMLSLYFVLQTIATVGYGDVNPTNSQERLFVNFLMLTGVVAFSFVSGALSSLMLNLDE